MKWQACCGGLGVGVITESDIIVKRIVYWIQRKQPNRIHPENKAERQSALKVNKVNCLTFETFVNTKRYNSTCTVYLM